MIESWAARDHTLVGGGVLQVDLPRKTEVDIDAGVTRCDDGDFERLVRQIVLEAEMRGEEVDIDRVREEVHRRFQSCQRVIARCTNPSLPNREIIVRYDPPVGDPVYRTVKTDANGCYEGFYLTLDEGNWTVTAEYPGDNCNGSSTAPPRVVCNCHQRERG